MKKTTIGAMAFMISAMGAQAQTAVNMIGFGGGTIRTYELNPTQRVKDHRTMCLSNNPAKVFDGDIKEFLDAFLREQLGKPAA